MVNSSNRSPSPLTSRSNLNLPRKSFQTDPNHPTRKPFNGTSHLNNPKKFNFLTPANTPSEIGPRNWVGCEEKENEKAEFLREKLRSPSNVSKSFMAPTISAASKFTPSPRKKILVERNDPVRTSISLSNGKATFFSSLTSDFDTKPDFCPERKNTGAMEASEQVKVVPKPLKKVTFKEVAFDPHNLAESCSEKVSINLDLEHNPGIDIVKNSFEGYDCDGNKKVEDSCMCELSENLSFLEGQEESGTGDSWEVLEDVSSVENLADEITEDRSVPKQKTKPPPLRNWKPVCFFLLLLGTFMLSATNVPKLHSLVPKGLNFEISEWSEVADIAKVNFGLFTGRVKQWSANIPAMHSLVPKDLNFEISEWSEVADIAKVIFDEFTGKVKQWLVNSISYLSKIVLPVLDVDEMRPLQFRNSTIAEDGYQINGLFSDGGFEEGTRLELKEVEEEEGEDEMEEVNDKMKEDEKEIEEVKDEMEELEDEMEEAEETNSSFDSTVHIVSVAETCDTVSKRDTSEDDHNSARMDNESHEETETGSSVASTTLGDQERFSDVISTPETPDTTHLKLHASEIDYDGSAAETELLLEEKKLSKSVESKKMVGTKEIFLDAGFTDESSRIPKAPESSSEESRIHPQTMILGTSLVLLGLGTAAVIIYLKTLSKKVPTCVDTSHTFSKVKFLQRKEPSIKDVIGESCASEMSSSQKRSSSYQKAKNTKSESLVYSSEYSFGSPSYGSFTTYETIKHGDGDDEIMTPVRRSSRIRKQVTAQ